jgi:hypothetical protein
MNSDRPEANYLGTRREGNFQSLLRNYRRSQNHRSKSEYAKNRECRIAKRGARSSLLLLPKEFQSSPSQTHCGDHAWPHCMLDTKPASLPNPSKKKGRARCYYRARGGTLLGTRITCESVDLFVITHIPKVRVPANVLVFGQDALTVGFNFDARPDMQFMLKE